MKDNKFNFCPECGSRNIETLGGGRKWGCPECGMKLYNNVASAVGILITDSQGRILFEKRAKEPRKGFLAVPGGFCEPGETLEEAALRECSEEIGVRPKSVKYLCSFPNTYEYRTVMYKTCDAFFEAVLPEDFTLKADEGEVSAFEWVKPESKEQIKDIPLAFESAQKTLEVYLSEKDKK